LEKIMLLNDNDFALEMYANGHRMVVASGCGHREWPQHIECALCADCADEAVDRAQQRQIDKHNDDDGAE
jgi:hypothetical protein